MDCEWNAVTTNNDGSPLKDFDHYEVWITDGVKDVYYKTKQLRFDFTIEMNRAAFGTPPTATPASPLTFRVRAKDQTGHPTNIGNNWNLPITTPNPAPAAPATLTATIVNDGVTLKWSRVLEPDIAYYRVYRGSTQTYTFDSAHIIWEGSAVTLPVFQDYNLVRHYYVVAVDVFGTESPGTYLQVITPSLVINTGDGSAPPVSAAPTLVSGIGVIFARWPGVSNNERVTYEVHIAPQSSGASWVSPGTLYAKTDATSITIKTDANGDPLNIHNRTNRRVLRQNC